MSTFLVPLVNTPQTFQLPLGDTTYQVTSKWNESDESGWTLDIADQDNVPIVCNVPLVTGADLLEGLGYLGFTGRLFVYTDGDETAVPTYEDLGVESNLYFVTED